MALQEANEMSALMLNLPQEFPMGMRVLVLDSDPVSLGDLSINLQEYGYNVTCSDLNDAVFLLNLAFDLIICDLNVQGRGVFQAAYNMINDVQVPVIMMCADERGEVMKAVQEGACHCLIKPIERADLKYIWQHAVRIRMPTIEVNEVSMLKRVRSPKDVDNDLSTNDDNRINNKRRKQRFIWTDELREQFVKAVEKLGGVGSAIPNKILEIMKNSDEVKRILKDIKYNGEITRENISSYLQKYKRSIEPSQNRSSVGTSSCVAADNVQIMYTKSSIRTSQKAYLLLMQGCNNPSMKCIS
ncbi:Two-component response regulator ARR14 [Acorus calamus]|uniref:Two-component response regulator ARR14 n=1 Tax=Acorus calamus TaxID=4465 RepID=A0AAV9F0V4_ACOCL|nr:Two-component response regulator ARR14 [Acorus calamus]